MSNTKLLKTICQICGLFYILMTGILANADINPICAQPPDSGSGHNLCHLWYFNNEVVQCRELVYRGLGGNHNRFNTIEECESSCMRQHIGGAERFGSNIKAPVDHKDHNAHKTLFSYRLGPMERPKKKFNKHRAHGGYSGRKHYNELDTDYTGDAMLRSFKPLKSERKK